VARKGGPSRGDDDGRAGEEADGRNEDARSAEQGATGPASDSPGTTSSEAPTVPPTPTAAGPLTAPPPPKFSVAIGDIPEVMPFGRLVTIESGRRWLVLGTRSHTCDEPAQIGDPQNATVVFDADSHVKELRLNLSVGGILVTDPEVQIKIVDGRAVGTISFSTDADAGLLVGSGTFDVEVCKAAVPIRAADH